MKIPWMAKLPNKLISALSNPRKKMWSKGSLGIHSSSLVNDFSGTALGANSCPSWSIIGLSSGPKIRPWGSREAEGPLLGRSGSFELTLELLSFFCGGP